MTYTEYIFDDNDRQVGHRSTVEAEWDSEQVDLLLALDAYRRDLGPNGELMSEATSPKADPNYYGADRIWYMAHGPFTNQAEKRRLDAIDEYKKSAGDDANLNGMYWAVEKQS